MALKDVLSLCGRVGLVVAAFAFVAGIVAGPLLEKIWFSHLTVTERTEMPVIPPADTLTRQPSEKQG